MKSRQILWNAGTTSAQVILNAALLFFLYRYLVRWLGISAVGVWSLVLATTSFATLTSQGFSNGIVRYVAQYSAREDSGSIAAVVESSFISTACVAGVICAAAYFPARAALKFLLPRETFPAAEAILPWGVLSVWVDLLALVPQATLTGLQRVDYNNCIDCAGSVAYLFLAFLLVPRYGLLGLAWAQLIQSALLLVAPWILLQTLLPSFLLVPRRWNTRILREVARYGLQFQSITLLQAIREPITKALLARFGGLRLCGLYDLAARWVVNFRELLVQANEVLVPTIAYLRERSANELTAMYRDSYRILFFLSLPMFSGLVILSPAASRFWLSRVDPTFVALVAFLAGGWLINVLSNPSYVMDLGMGAWRGIAAGCAITAALNPLLGFLAGRYIGGVYIAAASAFSLALGYLIIVMENHLRECIDFSVLLPAGSAALIGSSVGATALFLAIFHSGLAARHGGAGQQQEFVLRLFLLLAIGWAFWCHPLRKRLLRAVVSRAPVVRA